MKKRFLNFAGFLLSLALIFGACSSGANGNRNQDNPAPSEPDPSPSVPSEEPSASFWDVSEIDVSHVGENRRLIAFTFDDGVTDQTDDLLNVFESFNAANPDCVAHATLFTVGARVNGENSHTLARAAAMNFELGNHTYSHTDLTSVPLEKAEEELRKTDDVLKAIDGKSSHLVRPAGGHVNSQILALYPAPFINWTPSLDTSDWQESVTENDIFNTVNGNLLDGGIVLMHQGYGKTVSAVKRLLPALKSQGYQVVSVSELIKFYGIKAELGKLYESFL